MGCWGIEPRATLTVRHLQCLKNVSTLFVNSKDKWVIAIMWYG